MLGGKNHGGETAGIGGLKGRRGAALSNVGREGFTERGTMNQRSEGTEGCVKNILDQGSAMRMERGKSVRGRAGGQCGCALWKESGRRLGMKPEG